jgi:hypothetical protein
VLAGVPEERGNMQIEALKSIGPEAIPRRGTDLKPLIDLLAGGPAAFAMPFLTAPSRVRNLIRKGVKERWPNNTARVTIHDGTVYVELVEAQPRKAPTGKKRGRKPKAVAE